MPARSVSVDRTSPRRGARLTVSDADLGALDAARALVPQAFRGAMQPRVMVCRLGSTASGRVAGAVALLRVPSPNGAPIFLGVREESRGAGVEEALLRAAIDVAAPWQQPGLFTPANVVRGGADAEMWRRLGFRRRLEEVHYTFDLATVAARIRPLAILAARRRPASARLVPLDACGGHQHLIGMHETHVGSCESRTELAARLRGEGPRSLVELSTVLLEGDEPVGMILQRRDDDRDDRDDDHDGHGAVAYLESFVVVPERRSSWASVALLGAAIDALSAAGLTSVRCCAGARHRQTHLLALDFGVDAARIEDRYFLPIEPEASATAERSP